MDLLYRAWLPNVSGRISFANIKGYRVRGRASAPKTINRLSHSNPRWICSWQVRELSDALFPLLHTDSKLSYFLIAEVSSEADPLTGKILTVAQSEVKRCTLDLKGLFAAQPELPSHEQAEAFLKGLGALNSARAIDFRIEWNGATTLQYVSEDQELADTLVFEAFSFLKDLVHAHKFHRADEDAIVVPLRVGCENDQAWIAKTQHGMHGSIVAAYRSARHPADLINALGRLAYLEAFIDLFKEHGLVDPINTSRLRSALESRLSAIQERDSRHSLFVQVSLPILVAIIALVIAMTQLLQVPCITGLADLSNCSLGTFNVDPRAVLFAKEIIESWQTYLYGTILGVATITFYGYRRHLYRWVNDRLGRAGIGGYLVHLLFTQAVSSRWGRVLASLWLGLWVTFMVLLLAAVIYFLLRR